MAAALRTLLARLAADPDQMTQFIQNPMRVIDEAGLSDAERQALLSRDESRIQLAVAEDLVAAPPNGGVQPEKERARAEAKGRGQLVVIGTGLRSTGHFTAEALAWVRAADKVLYVVGDPVAEEVLRRLNPAGAESLQVFYGEGKDRQQTYDQMVERILECVRAGLRTCAAFYGHPGVFVYPSHASIRRARAEGHSALMLPGISAEDCLFADIGIDPATYGCQSYEATDFLFSQRRVDPSASLVLWQVGVVGNTTFTSGEYDRSLLPLLVTKLCEIHPPHHEVVVYEAAVQIGCAPRLTRIPLAHLASVPMTAATTLFVPPSAHLRPDYRYHHAAAPLMDARGLGGSTASVPTASSS